MLSNVLVSQLHSKCICSTASLLLALAALSCDCGVSSKRVASRCAQYTHGRPLQVVGETISSFRHILSRSIQNVWYWENGSVCSKQVHGMVLSITREGSGLGEMMTLALHANRASKSFIMGRRRGSQEEFAGKVVQPHSHLQRSAKPADEIMLCCSPINRASSIA